MRQAVTATLAFILLAGSLSAATFEKVTDRQLLDRADLVVVGTVGDLSYTQDANGRIFTDYPLSVEDVIKGDVAHSTIVVRELGGRGNGHFLAIPGSSRYETGTRVLAFLRERTDGSYFTAFMGLGEFEFARREGRDVLIRSENGIEIDAADAFAPRAADLFLNYLRAVAHGLQPTETSYTLSAATHADRLVPSTNAAADYAQHDGSPDRPIRWQGCESGCSIPFKYNGSQPGVSNITGGINDALDAWTDDPNSFVNLSLTGTSSVTDVSVFDNENTIVLNNDKNDQDGSPDVGQCDGAFACGLVWLNDGVGGTTHVFDGIPFYTALGGDVIVRPGSMSQAFFVRVIAHEVGHALALRHSNDGTPSGGSTNIMYSVLPAGGGATLGQWDKDAMASLYGNGLPCVPPSISGTSGAGTYPSGTQKQLTVTATGTNLHYEWYEGTTGDTSTPVGTDSNKYTTPPITSTMNFWVRVSGDCGTPADSQTITVQASPCTAPTITGGPDSQTIPPNTSATLHVTVNGSSPRTYQWYRGNLNDTSNPVGSNSATYTTPALTTTTSYWVYVFNSCGFDEGAATITVSGQCAAPTITVQPQSQTILPNGTATLSVSASGTAPLTYQWYQGPLNDMSNPVGTNSNTFTTPALTTTTSYWVKVSNSCDSADSALATITVSGGCVAPSISSQTTNPQSFVGKSVDLTVFANGTAPLSYQWYEGESPDMTHPIAGATSSTYSAGPFNATGVFKYWVLVSNDCNHVNGATIAVTVGCQVLDVPVISAPAATFFATGYNVFWTGEPDLTSSFELEEATNDTFTTGLQTFVVSDALQQFIDPHTEITTDTRFYYRVRAINGCNGILTDWSDPTSTVVTAPEPEDSTSFAVSIPEGTTGDFTQDYLVPGFGDTATPGDTFLVTTDAPWLTVFPSSGALSAGGTTIQLTFHTAGLDIGTTTATINVVRTQGSAAKIGSQGSSTANLPFSISIVTPVSPTPRDANAPPGTMIILAAAHADGIGTRFQTDVRIVNASNNPITYDIAYTPSGTNGTQTGKTTTLTIAGNDSKGFDDIIKAWYGAGVLDEAGIGTIEIRPQGGADPNATFASSRTYAVTDAGTLGQFIPAIPLEKFISDVGQNPLAKLSLQQVANSAAYRTNFGFVEGSGSSSATLMAKLLDGNGNILATKQVQLPAFGHQQSNFATLFGNVPLDDGRMEVEVTSAAGKVTAYASVVDNETSDPLLVFPVQASNLSTTHYVAPGIAELQNGTASNFHSDMRVYNAGSSPETVTLNYYPQTGDSTPRPAAIERTIASGDVLAVDNVLPTLWGLTATGGAVTIDTQSNSSLVVTSRTFSRNDEGGTYGQFIPGVTAQDAVGLGDRPLEVLQLEESAQYRTNVGLVEVTGHTAKVEVTAYKPDEKITRVTNIDLQPNEFRQIGRIFAILGLPTVYNGRVTARVVSGDGRVSSYGSVIDNRTVDPTYVPSQ